MRIDDVPGSERADELVAQLAAVWERSVRATHDFLAEDDIVGMRPEVGEAVRAVERLAVGMDDDGRPIAFAGASSVACEEDPAKLEMLFVDAPARGMGAGGALLDHAVACWGVRLVDVNEQNPQACGFYEHKGFAVVSRSALDDAGRPFPILHLALAADAIKGI